MNIYATDGIIDIARSVGYNAYTANKTLDDVQQEATVYAEKIYCTLSKNNAKSTKRYYHSIRDAYITGAIKASRAMQNKEVHNA